MNLSDLQNKLIFTNFGYTTAQWTEISLALDLIAHKSNEIIKLKTDIDSMLMEAIRMHQNMPENEQKAPS